MHPGVLCVHVLCCVVFPQPTHVYTHSQPLATQLRSRGCYIIQYVKPATLTLWVGSKSTAALRKVAQKAIRCLKERLKTGDIVTVQEGQEPGDFWASIGDRNSYVTLLHGTCTILRG